MRTLLIIAASLIAITMPPASAHDAPSGWTYPIECCDDRDCEPIDTADVTVGDGFYIWRHHRIAFNSPSVRNSPDSLFHGCEAGHWGDEGGKKILTCFFVPLGL